jgi:uncharacterized protein
MDIQNQPAIDNSQVAKPNERIGLIDSLRGYALMGLFLVHMIEYYELYWYRPVESVYKDFTFAFFGGKSYAMFALLFGVSFFIIFNSKKNKGVDFSRQISWRFCLLLLTGILHGLIYGGDILQVLAIAGFLLLLIYRSPDYVLLIIAAILLLQVPAIIYLIQFIVQDRKGYEQPLHWSLFGEVYKVYANGSFKDLLNVNFTKAVAAKWTFMLESGRLSTILGMTLFGFWLGKIGFFIGKNNDKKKYAVCFLVSLLFGSMMYFAKSPIALLIKADHYWLSNSIFNSYMDLAFTFASIFVFGFLYQSEAIKKVLSILAPCGRMSLTLYVFQSIVFIPFFYGFGMGAYNYLGQANSFMIGLVSWLVQIFFANYWFGRYYYGPLEWMWRSATYLRKDIKFKRSRLSEVQS